MGQGRAPTPVARVAGWPRRARRPSGRVRGVGGEREQDAAVIGVERLRATGGKTEDRRGFRRAAGVPVPKLEAQPVEVAVEQIAGVIAELS